MLISRELGPGGSERQLTEIATYLDRSRFVPHVGCFRGGGIRLKELEAAGVTVREFPIPSLRKPSAGVSLARMGHYFQEHAIDIVHAFDVPADLIGVPVAAAFRVPVVLSSQRAHRSLTRGVRWHLLRMIDRIADGIVVNCEAMRRHLVEDEKVPPAKVAVCRNGIDTVRFSPAGAALPASLAGATLVIGTVAVLRPEKDLVTLLRAFQQVRGLWPGMKLLMVGGGPCLEALQAESHALDIADACVFEPPSTQVASWLRAIDIFVLPSISEALSNSLMEAMACGCCAIASRVGGNPELVAHGTTGLLFEPRDAAGLARQLSAAILDPDRRRRMAEAGLALIRNEFSIQASVERMSLIYDSFLKESGVRGLAGDRRSPEPRALAVPPG